MRLAPPKPEALGRPEKRQMAQDRSGPLTRRWQAFADLSQTL